MKILNNVEEIFAKYDLKPIKLPNGFKNIYEYHDKNPEDCTFIYNPEITDRYLNEKYADYIPHGWYGFDISVPIIPEWMNIIDEIVELCTEIDQDFEIHQIKLKFGAICFYVYSGIIEDTNDVEVLILNKLYDKALIY
jgi:hypothetical protein